MGDIKGPGDDGGGVGGLFEFFAKGEKLATGGGVISSCIFHFMASPPKKDEVMFPTDE